VPILLGALLGRGFLSVVVGFVVTEPGALSYLLSIWPLGLYLVVVFWPFGRKGPIAYN
jgi:hypothetical protein